MQFGDRGLTQIMNTPHSARQSQRSPRPDAPLIKKIVGAPNSKES